MDLSQFDFSDPFVLTNIFGVAFPFHGELSTKCDDVLVNRPLSGLYSLVERSELSAVGWQLYTLEMATGLINNGGLDGLVGNRPGLLGDLRLLLREVSPTDLAAQYETAASEVLQKYDAFRDLLGPDAEDDALSPFWDAISEIEVDSENPDVNAFETSVSAAYRTGSAFSRVQAAVLNEIRSNPAALLG